ncbi:MULTISPECIES: LacI family DNA-binding transcriptional regulator [Glaesserella]|uniref:HTH-type transcriptional regulator TreR n=1 Tax=Glaesserella australis TaxID=2094024 RepID=A0A328BYP3_9PAST|nr:MULTISPECIES: LacI family DNA-binding transcriptional regulator [Glaesserella]AUI66187.1 HTH-type transcriptional regulator TreR [Glaesserella sp. 15-184]RAL19209.1 HTH-type transcriptional regulator TreR [Glaesserella australis]
MKYTIKDIALLAKVGKSTVSRVLNDDPNVSEETRQRVQDIISQVGFEPNRSARAMRGAADPVVGIIVTRLNSVAESQTLSAILHELYQKGITPLIVESKFQPELVSKHFQLFKQRQVNGIILFGFSQLNADMMKSWKGALVTVAREYPQISSVVYDDEKAVEALMFKLYMQGHRDIAYLGVKDSDETTGKLRNQSYLNFCQKYQLEPNLVKADLGAESGYQNVGLLFDKPISALLCASSSLAVGAFKYMQEIAQIRPLACIGQNEMLQFVAPKLISLDFGYPQAGKGAVTLLLKQLDGNKNVEQIRVTFGQL